jgi:rhamnose transport system substrate-binding protein
MRNRRNALKLMTAGALAGFARPGLAAPTPPTKLRLVMVAKALGIPLFDEIRDGGLEAAKELDTTELIYAGPVKATAQEQIQLVEAMIVQRVDGIMISANDANALVPICKKALLRGIKVVSFDAPVASGARLLQLEPCDPALVGVKCLQLIAKTLSYQGEVAILSGAGQGAWLAPMKLEWVKPDYARLKLATLVQANDTADRSYSEAQQLLTKHPNLKGIVATTPVTTVAAAKAVLDAGAAGRVFVSGLGLPSEMKAAVEAGVTDTFAMWNPLDLGYSVTQMLAQIVTGKATGMPNTSIQAGRMGEIKLGPDGVAAMAELQIFDKSNIDKFAKLF